MGYEINLQDKVVLVTGAGQGIGAAIAEIFAKAGAQTVINDVCEKEQADEALKACSSYGKEAYYSRTDISDEEAVKAMVEDIVNRYGRIDVLVNNAGIVADWDKSYDVNTKAMYTCSEVCRPYLAEHEGNIIILTSASIFTGGTGYPQYNVTKAGCFALIRFLARNYAKDGIRVNGIAPAVIMSKMLVTRFGSEEAIHEHYRNVMPLGKIGYPEDIAGIALFLGSDLSRFLTGEVIVADGGRMHIGG